MFKSIFPPRQTEAGRIRIGVMAKTKNGKSYPKRLETFRLTSTNKPRLEAAAAIYGGTVTEWQDPPGEQRQWELITEVNSLPCGIPHAAALSQAWEQWQGGACIRRCDGEFITHAINGELRGCECQCPADISERLEAGRKGEACLPRTRVSVYLYEIPPLGAVWRLDTGGVNAGVEMPATVPILQDASAAGAMLKCEMNLIQRTERKATGQREDLSIVYETRHYPIVQINPVDITLGHLLSGDIPSEALIGGRRIQEALAPARPLLAESSSNEAYADLTGSNPADNPAWDREQNDPRMALRQPEDLPFEEEPVDTVTGEILSPAPQPEQVLAALRKEVVETVTQLVADKRMSPQEQKNLAHVATEGSARSVREATLDQLGLIWNYLERTYGEHGPEAPEEGPDDPPTKETASQKDIEKLQALLIQRVNTAKLEPIAVEHIITLAGGEGQRIDKIMDIGLLNKISEVIDRQLDLAKAE